MIRLKFMREQRGLSQRALGALASVDASYICNAERKGWQLYPAQAARLAEALCWEGDPEALFEEIEEVQAV